MPLTPGTKLGPYEIQSPIGAGGMGEVYRARDTRLGRDVALKILPESLAHDSDRLRRFEQETQAVAALNHPNILAIYDVGQYNGVPFLVSELLEGESLRAIIDRGALPQRKVIDYGVQISQALAAAHEKGVVHRDLKPENLFITRDGRAKVLDFGLAKVPQKATAAPDGHTLTSSPTAAGVVMGTASYMAPEQVRGEPVDARTDIFGLGTVLFEMLSGRRAFQRDTAAETMTAVLKDDVPELAEAQPAISTALDRIIRRCVEKSPEQRFQSARDLSFALGVLSGSAVSGAIRATEVAPRRRSAPLWPLLALVAIAAAALWFAWRPRTQITRMQFAIPVPGEVSQPALSPDGRMLAFVSPDERTGAPMIFVQRVGSPKATELAQTHGAAYPFWSPDAAYIAFFANGKLQKLALAGGSVQTLAHVTYARGGSWGTKNVILYSPAAGGPMWRVNADGSNAARMTDKLLPVDTSIESHRWPLFLPDGEHFLFLQANFGTNSGEDSHIYISSLSGKGAKPLLSIRSNSGYASGRLFYVDEKKALRAVTLDIDKGVIQGDSQVIADTVGYQPSVYLGAFAVANDGTVVYNDTAAAALSQLTLYDRSGKELGRVGEAAVQANPTFSPDGSRVAVDITDLKANNLDVWIDDVKKGTSTRFTFAPAEETEGVWSRDGSMIAFRSNSRGSLLKVKKAHGLEPEKTAIEVEQRGSLAGTPEVYDIIPNSWSPDDKQILCSIQSFGRGSQLLLVNLSDGQAKTFLGSKAAETNGQISADGKWVAYA
ncbi:MAG: serine/threonine-protein kinase, partial [Acidobacteriaceae bacterium]|nr:serine/threonine-protein kinase [Acidobacteriaceae bacterium]